MNESAKTRYELFFPSELNKAIAGTPVAYIPAGSLEWHGEHLALGADYLRGHQICLRAAEQVGQHGRRARLAAIGVDARANVSDDRAASLCELPDGVRLLGADGLGLRQHEHLGRPRLELAEPLTDGATSEVTVTATIPEYAEASLGGDIVITR